MLYIFILMPRESFTLVHVIQISSEIQKTEFKCFSSAEPMLMSHTYNSYDSNILRNLAKKVNFVI